MKKIKKQAEEIEMDPQDVAKEMSWRSFQDGFYGYIDDAGDLLVGLLESPASETIAEKLTKRLVWAEQDLRLGLVRAEFLSPDDAERIIYALQLTFKIRYQEFTFVGKGGSWAEDDAFDVDEGWGSCDATDARQELVKALMNYCVSAGVVAKRIGAAVEQRLFLRCLELMELNCRAPDYENVYGGLSKSKAKAVCDWLCLASQRLWAQLQVARRDKGWTRETKSSAEQGPTAVPKKGGRKGKILISDDMPDTSGIVMGPWAKEILYSFNGTTRTLVFKGNKRREPGERIACPLGADEPWKHIVGMVTSTDPEGWYEVPEADISCYRQQFLRSDKDKKGHPTKNSVALHLFYDHIQNRNASGEHAATQIRLVRRKIRNLGTQPRKRQKATAVKGVKTPKIKV